MAATQESITKIEAAMKGTNNEKDLSKGLKDLNDRLSEAVGVWTKLSEKQPDNKLVNSILKDTNKIIKLSREATDKNIESQKKPNILISDIFKLLHKTDKEKKQLSKTANKELAVALGKLSTERVAAGSVPMRSLEQAYKKKAPGIVAAKYEEGPAKAALAEPYKTTPTTMLAMLVGTLADSVKTIVKVVSPANIVEKLSKSEAFGRMTMGGEKSKDEAEVKSGVEAVGKRQEKTSKNLIVVGLTEYFGKVASKQSFWKKFLVPAEAKSLKGVGTELEEKRDKEPISIATILKGISKGVLKVFSTVGKIFMNKFLLFSGALFLLFDVVHTWLKEEFPGYKKTTDELWKSLKDVNTTLDAFKGKLKDVSDGWDTLLKLLGIRNKDESDVTKGAILKEFFGIKSILSPTEVRTSIVSGISSAFSEFFKGMKPKISWSSSPLVGRGASGSFQKGTDYVPETGIYELHKGEAVIPAKSVSLLKEPSTVPLTKSVVASQEQAQSATREIIKLTKVMEKQTTRESTTQIGMGIGGIEVTRIPDKVDDVLLVFATLGAI